MDQRRIGEFLKELRKEKGLTQEQLADKLFVSRRTVSRWETGSNMPDLDVLVELADLYDVDLRDILSGQRRDNMDKELKDTLLQAADYTQDLKKKVKKRMNLMFIGAMIAMVLYLIAIFFAPDIDTGLWGLMKGFTLGVSFGMLIIGFIITSPFAETLMKRKNELLR